ncbi:uncharacterized protein I303_103457 [Kwoniella dejecticola CBS 10117]|uniref:Uncharacterized protein n=1 Tax=Kwoniella dejecticola CBS 10117 TaxID=1296121 RepID=A0A1A6A6V6_9TREE|nr:uncharacterized protein I303_03480 [Kwoniella dejecticola CBS 10117]OBR85768.1 hypothetical protein I303_03480 [Kwoniella dejecticola CBS 10117]
MSDFNQAQESTNPLDDNDASNIARRIGSQERNEEERLNATYSQAAPGVYATQPHIPSHAEIEQYSVVFSPGPSSYNSTHYLSRDRAISLKERLASMNTAHTAETLDNDVDGGSRP